MEATVNERKEISLEDRCCEPEGPWCSTEHKRFWKLYARAFRKEQRRQETYAFWKLMHDYRAYRRQLRIGRPK